MVDATQLCLSCNCTHGGCYATVLVLSLHTWWMLRNCACLVIAHMVDSTQLCLSCNCTHGGCYATVMRSYRVTYWPKKQTMLQDRKKYVFFSAEAFNTHKFHCVFFFEDTNPWKKWDEINIWTNKPYMEFNTLAAFRASSTKCHVNIAQGRNHGRNLVWGSEV